MMIDKHTPGPWHWVRDDNDEPVDIGDDMSYPSSYSLRTVAKRKRRTGYILPDFVLTEAVLDGVSIGADARLIAAAPDLLEACKRTRQGYMNLIEVGALPHKGWDEQTREYIAELDELIAKAEGES